MFTIAVLIGIYSYLIFSIGLLGLLKIKIVLILSIVYFFLALRFFKKHENIKFKVSSRIFNSKLFLFFSLIFLLQVFVNLIGALGPELGFDALWYHLTLPKLYILNNTIMHIPGGLLYYSDMPRLTEMLYAAGLLFVNEIIAKLVSFTFGILICISIYKISRKFLNQLYSLLGVIIFYSNLVVGWQSITAYIDLPRAFFEVMALWGFLNFTETKEKKWLIGSAVLLGLAISTKLLAFGTLPIFICLITYFMLISKENIKKIISHILIFILISILIPLPWFIFSYTHTGSFFYPFFSNIYSLGLSWNILNPINFVKDVFLVLLKSNDPISPIYLILIPLAAVYYKKLSFNAKLILFFSFLSILVWYITPRTGGGRFILPYLPAYSIIASIIISKIKNKYIHKYLISIIFIIAISSVLYRGATNSKYMPVILGQESKSTFLSKNLNFSFGDFYDTDGYFKNNMQKNDNVLLYGFHNLYYVDFPFVDSSWVKKGDEFNYIAVQNSSLPKRFLDWNPVYSNSITKVKLYKKGDIRWTY